MENKKYFYGNEISEHGVQHNRVDYAALAKSFDAVLCSYDITKLFYRTLDGECTEPEQVNGFIDNSYDIDELQEQLDEMQEQLDEMQEQIDEFEIETDDDIKKYNSIENDIDELQEQIDEIQEQIDELEREQDEEQEICQYYIISDSGYNILKYHTNEIVYYIDSIGVYVWGVTHYGTNWKYVLTDIKIND